MVASTSLPDVAAPPPSPEALRNLSPLERTRHAPAVEYVNYSISDDGVHQSRLECLQSIANLKRPSPYWYPYSILTAWIECPRCLRNVPSPYMEGRCCADCVSNAAHDNRVAWVWFEENHRYLGWWQRGLTWYSTRPRLFPNVFRFDDEWEEADEPPMHPFTEACAALKAMNADLIEPDDEEPDPELVAALLKSFERACADARKRHLEHQKA